MRHLGGSGGDVRATASSNNVYSHARVKGRVQYNWGATASASSGRFCGASAYFFKPLLM